MKFKLSIWLVVALGCWMSIGFGTSSCKHMPTMIDEPIIPVDTTDMPIDTTGMTDTTVMSEPCDPDLVYFQRDVLPILISNCTFSDCHDATDPQDGVILTNYQDVFNTGDVRPFDLNGSDLYEVLVDPDEDDRMPPLPRARLSNNQISTIAQWILQGAEDLTCEAPTGACDSTAVSFSQTVHPIIMNHCQGCHSGASPSGGLLLTGHAEIQIPANDGRLYGVIARLPGFPPMPQGGEQLPQCDIDKIKSWIDAGAADN